MDAMISFCFQGEFLILVTFRRSSSNLVTTAQESQGAKCYTKMDDDDANHTFESSVNHTFESFSFLLQTMFIFQFKIPFGCLLYIIMQVFSMYLEHLYWLY